MIIQTGEIGDSIIFMVVYRKILTQAHELQGAATAIDAVYHQSLEVFILLNLLKIEMPFIGFQGLILLDPDPEPCGWHGVLLPEN